MVINKVTDPAFLKYGRIIENIDRNELKAMLDVMEKMPEPEGVVYEPTIAELEALPVCRWLSDVFYGEMPIEIGYCNGHNKKLNGLASIIQPVRSLRNPIIAQTLCVSLKDFLYMRTYC